MIRAVTILCWLLLPVTALKAQEALAVPSGQPVSFLEAQTDIRGPAGLTSRFRFLAPQISQNGGMDYATAERDMAYLCVSYALPRLPSTGPRARQIVISLSDRPVAFGQTAPEATQFFESYRPEGAECVWEEF